jgi:cholesterol transport system auxiliary component
MSSKMKQHSPLQPCLFAIFLLLALLLQGCSSAMPGRDSKPVQHYLLEWQPANSQPAAADGPVLQITAASAAAGFDSSDMIYTRRPHQLERFALHRWADAPARMLDPLLVKAAEASGLFSAVAAPGTPVMADLRLDTQLQHLQQHVGNDASQVELAARFTLTDMQSGRQLASRSVQLQEPAASVPYDGVQAANRAVATLLLELTAFLRTELPRQ